MKWFGLTFALCMAAATVYALSRLSNEAMTLLVAVLIVAVSGAVVGAPIVALAYLMSRQANGSAGRGAAAAKPGDPYTELLQREYQERRYSLLMRKLDQQEQRLALPAPQPEDWPAEDIPAKQNTRQFVVLGDDDDVGK